MPTLDNKLDRFGVALHAVGAFVSLVLLAATYGFVYLSLDQQTQEAVSQAETKRRFLATAKSVTASHQSLQEQLADEEARLRDLFERIPQTPQESDFLAQLDRLARECGVSIRQFSRGSATDEGTHSGMEVRLSADASHASICRFLAGLADIRRLCHVRDLTVAAPDKANSTYPIDITLGIFFAPLRQASRR